MNITAIRTILLLSSASLFIGCSTKPEVEAQADVYSIMGIEHDPTLTLASSEPIISGDVEVIVYGSYMSAGYNPQEIKNQVEWNAKSFLGTRYVWGATGPDTFDCSGFTQWVYREVGIHIPRVSRDQARIGSYVNFHQLKRGDMVFFDTKKRKDGTVSHVGIYLGNGNFIHASSNAHQVVINNFADESFYRERFMWGRRVIQDDTHLASN